LKKQFPQVQVVEDDIYVKDGHIYTSAGVTAGMDLALALVTEDLGRAVALAIAKELVISLKRLGGQSQFHTLLESNAITLGKLKELPQWIWGNLKNNLNVDCMAQQASMSPRNFARVFLKEFGMTPGKFVEKVRIENARIALENSEHSIDEIASNSGFQNSERMCRAFQRSLKVTPSNYRSNFGII